MVPLFLLFATISGCGEGAVQQSTDGRSQSEQDALRIVSLSPAISRTLLDLGLDSHIVGRTPYCDSLPREMPVVGDLLDLDMERLVRVRPTHVLVQPSASGVDPALTRLANERGWRLAAWHLDSIEDVKRMVGELPATIDDDSATRAMDLLVAIDHALQPDERIFTGRVLLIFGTDPASAFGDGTYLHDVLVALGGTNAITASGYPQLTLEDVQRIDPEAIILVRPGAGNSLAVFGPVAKLNVTAVRENRLAVLSHPAAFLPSSAVIGVAEELREILREMTPRTNTDEHGWSNPGLDESLYFPFIESPLFIRVHPWFLSPCLRASVVRSGESQ